jgi:LmbE family N-acetylglucosaminyl deacetylase
MQTKTHHGDAEFAEAARRRLRSAFNVRAGRDSLFPPYPSRVRGESNRRRRRTASRNRASLKLCLALSLLLSNFIPPDAPRAQVRPVYDAGAVGLGLALRRLQTMASVLMIGAHPDDEDSALIARLARTDGARVAYLSLNRGEGGQNRIGTELFDALGVIRTEELLQARRLDGGQQFFARTFDFGFTKTREEAARRWGEREVLADMVRVIRRFRPLVVVSCWKGTPADGHGQHQYAGYLAPKAFRAAGDPTQFPEQLAEGLRPWQPLKFYVSERPGARAEANAAGAQILKIETGDYDPLLGRTAYELAMEGRSQHKSQGETALELRGPQATGARLVERAPSSLKFGETERTIFDGIDTSIRGIARASNLIDPPPGEALERIQRAAATALEKYVASDPRTVLTALVAGLAHTREARRELAKVKDDAARAEADFLLAQKEREFMDALRLATGVRLDVLADTETVARGDSFTVAVRAYAPEELKGRVANSRLRAPEGWRVEEAAAPKSDASLLPGRERPARESYYRVTMPETAEFTQPYWLRRERKGDLYEWGAGDPQTLPFALAPVVAEVEFDAGERFTVEQPVEFRYLDSVRGEVRRELNVVPELDVRLTPPLVIVSRGRAAGAGAPVEFTVQLTNNTRRTTEATGAPVAEGKVLLMLPEGWRAPAAQPFKFNERGERATLKFTARVPPGVAPRAYPVQVNASAYFRARPLPEVFRAFGYGERTFNYTHVQTHRYYVGADATLRVLDLKVAPVRVGYVMGSGDEVPAAIERMGLKVTPLGEEDLAAGDLSRFDTVVVGVRASQTRPDFVANHKRLVEFAERGGALVVQYQRPDYAAQKLPPFPAAMESRDGAGAQTISRVSDETAPVRVLAPAHAVFNFPNRITDDDWRGWVQERNLYNFVTLDSRYTPLLESHDPGEPENSGGMVYTRVGRGHYVYTSYAFFRQLPAGVPGAYHLFANLLSLPKSAPAAQPARRWRFRRLD